MGHRHYVHCCIHSLWRSAFRLEQWPQLDRKSTRLNSSHLVISYAVFCLKKKHIQDGHVEITSVSGDVIMNEVSGPVVQVNSSSGKIRYEGAFGGGGEYSFTMHPGDIDATAPTYASIDVTARSVKGQVDNDFPLLPKTHITFPVDKARSLVGTAGKAASSVKLLSFSGKIHLKKR